MEMAKTDISHLSLIVILIILTLLLNAVNEIGDIFHGLGQDSQRLSKVEPR